MNYYDDKNAYAWNLYKRFSNLKEMSQCINYIREHNLTTTADLEARAAMQQEKLDV